MYSVPSLCRECGVAEVCILGRWFEGAPHLGLLIVEIVVVLFLDVGAWRWKAKSGVEKGKESKDLKEDSAWQRRKKRRQEAGAEEQQVESDEEVATEIVSEEEEEEDKEIDDEEEEEEPKEEPKKSKKAKTDAKTKSKKKSKKEPNEEWSLVIDKFLSIWQFEQNIEYQFSGNAVSKESVSAQCRIEVCLKSACSTEQ